LLLLLLLVGFTSQASQWVLLEDKFSLNGKLFTQKHHSDGTEKKKKSKGKGTNLVLCSAFCSTRRKAKRIYFVDIFAVP
jgi:hypothetical protein